MYRYLLISCLISFNALAQPLFAVPKGLYVCFDGRSLSVTNVGYVWDARRGCFKTHMPCNVYQARHYGHYGNLSSQEIAYRTCRQGYPYHLGEMQTH